MSLSENLNNEFLQSKRTKITELLSKLPQSHQDLFWKLFPRDPIPESKLDTALDLIDRSIKKLEQKNETSTRPALQNQNPSDDVRG